jgi:hypothetical protein
LYGRETWFLIIREEHRLRVFQNRVLRRIFGPKRDKMVGGSKKLHPEKLRNLYYNYSRNIIIHEVKKDEMDRTCSTNGKKRDKYTVLVGNPEGNRPLRRHRRRW